MNSIRKVWRIHNIPALAILLLINTILYIVANRCGLGYTYDSHLYVDISKQISEVNILAAEGLNIKPPIYPFIIQLVGEGNLIYLNLTLFLISTVFSFLLSKELKSSGMKLIFFAFVSFSVPIILVHSFVWTEPIFIAVLMAAFYLLAHYESKGELKILLLTLILLFILPLIRFAGVFILLPVLTYLICMRHKHIVWLVSITALCTIFFAFWVFNFKQGFSERWETLVSPLVSTNFSRYVENTDSYLEAISVWLVPLVVYKPLRLVIAIIFISVTIYFSIISFKKKNLFKGGIFFIFVCYYFSIQTVFYVEFYSAERYLTPFYHFLVLSFLLILERFLQRVNLRMKRVIYGLLILWVSYGVIRTTKNVIFWNEVRCEASTTDLIQPNSF